MSGTRGNEQGPRLGAAMGPWALWAGLAAVLLPPGGTPATPASAAEKPPAPPAVRVAVDPRVELVSVIFRLAGHPEYSRGRIDSYTRDVEKQFGGYRGHKVAELARTLRRTRGVSYDACMSMAVHLGDVEKLDLRVALEPWPESLDRRWTAEGAREFLAGARQFARETSFAEFFAKHRPLYEVAESRMRSLLKEEGHLEWFDRFFGERPGAGFVVALGMLNGGQCYGPRVRTADGKEELYCVLGAWKTDAEGQPAFDRTMLGTIVHEFCHSYANPIVNRHEADLKAAGEKIYARVAPAMKRQAYGHWRTMLYESLVRACVVRYTRRHLGEAVAREAVAEERRRGFAWVGSLSDLLGQYEAQRDRYPTLDAFAPQIVKFFDDLAGKLD